MGMNSAVPESGTSRTLHNIIAHPPFFVNSKAIAENTKVWYAVRRRERNALFCVLYPVCFCTFCFRDGFGQTKRPSAPPSCAGKDTLASGGAGRQCGDVHSHAPDSAQNTAQKIHARYSVYFSCPSGMCRGIFIFPIQIISAQIADRGRQLFHRRQYLSAFLICP